MTCKEAEPKFFRLGEELQSVHGEATQLTRQVLNSVNLIGGNHEEGILHDLHHLAEASVAWIDGGQRTLTEKAEQTKTVQEQLDKLSELFLQVNEVGRYLSIVAINIRIESARLDGSNEFSSVVGPDTASLAAEMKTVSGSGVSILKKVWGAAWSLRNVLSKGLEENTAMGRHANGLVQNASWEIETLIAATLQVAKEAGDHAVQVSRQVSNLVVAVQFHDSMSQRIEHIAMALADVETILIKDAPDKLSLVISIMKLQEAQLKGVIGDISRVHERCCQSFDEVISGFDTLMIHLSGIITNAKQDAARGLGLDSFERLRSSFGELDRVLRRGRIVLEPVRQAASLASDTLAQVSGLVQSIHSIGSRSRMLAFNAIVSSTHLGVAGCSLEVLAKEIKLSSNQSAAILENSDDLLEVVANAANKLGEQDISAEADVSLEDSVTELMREHDQFMRESTAALRGAEEIKSVVSRSKADLEFLPVLVERLSRSLDRLVAINAELTPSATDNHSIGQDKLEEITSRYTMDQEREIHQVVFGLGSANVIRFGTKAGQHGTKATFFDEGRTQLENNIELFGDEESRPKDHVTFVCETGAKTQLSAERQAEDSDDLGSNVELF